MKITTIGLDIAKNVFQVHGIDAAEKVVVRKQLRRGQVLAFFRALPRCLIGIEACATSHCWARELEAWPPSAADAGEGREGLRQAQQERCRRRRGDLRDGTAADHAFCSDQIGRAAGAVDAASRAGPSGGELLTKDAARCLARRWRLRISSATMARHGAVPTPAMSASANSR